MKQTDDKLEKIRISDFTTAWNALDFHVVFRGARDANELREMIEELYLVTLGLFDAPRVVHRATAVFLLLALYKKQPKTSSPPTQIPVIRSRWFQLVNTFRWACAAQQADVCFALVQLMKDGALRLAHSTRPLGPAHALNLSLLASLEAKQ